MKTKLIKPVLFLWANHHDKNWKHGEPHASYTLPTGTSCTVVDTRRIKVVEDTFLTLYEIGYKNPLSGVISQALVTVDCVR